MIEPGEQFVQRQNEVGILGKGTKLIEQPEPDPPAAPLLPVPIPGVVDEDAPHRFRRSGEDVPAAVEVLVANEPQVRLVDQGGCVEGVAGGFGRHVRGGELPQFVMYFSNIQLLTQNQDALPFTVTRSFQACSHSLQRYVVSISSGFPSSLAGIFSLPRNRYFSLPHSGQVRLPICLCSIATFA
jgi:hypothetical protein